MFKKTVYFNNIGRASQFISSPGWRWTTFLYQGLAFFALAFLVLAMPRVVAVFIATFLMLIGSFFVGIALKTRRLSRKSEIWTVE